MSFGTGNESANKAVILTCHDVAEYAIKQMFRKKQVIIPGTMMKVAAFLRRIVPDKALARVVYMIQSKKCMVR